MPKKTRDPKPQQGRCSTTADASSDTGKRAQQQCKARAASSARNPAEYPKTNERLSAEAMDRKAYHGYVFYV